MAGNENKTVRELAVQIPGAARIFEELGIDYCCGGDTPLSEACGRAGLAFEDVLSSLERAQCEPAPFRDWSQGPLTELATHIVEKHHTFTKSESSRLEALFAKVSA